jgi:hypothetical protein
MLFVSTWRTFDNKRSPTFTMFASMDADADKKDAGDCQLLGRWMNLASSTGMLVCEAPSVEAAYKWFWNWAEDAVDGEVRPMLDDNQLLEILLGAPPAFRVNYGPIGMEAPQGSSLFMLKAKMYKDKKEECYNAIANLAEEQYKADHGNLTVLCKYFDLGKGEVIAVVAAKHETAVMDLHKWSVSAESFIRFLAHQ